MSGGPHLEPKVQDDMHSHRRRDDSDDVRGHRLEAAAESTFAKLLARYGMPLLLGIVSYFAGQMLSDIRVGLAEQSRTFAEQAAAQSAAIAQLRADLRVLGTRMDEGVIRQIDQHGRQIENHEQRLQALERSP